MLTVSYWMDHRAPKFTDVQKALENAATPLQADPSCLIIELLIYPEFGCQKGGVARRHYFVQKVLPLMRQRQNAQKLSWEASFAE